MTPHSPTREPDDQVEIDAEADDLKREIDAAAKEGAA